MSEEARRVLKIELEQLTIKIEELDDKLLESKTFSMKLLGDIDYLKTQTGIYHAKRGDSID